MHRFFCWEGHSESQLVPVEGVPGFARFHPRWYHLREVSPTLRVHRSGLLDALIVPWTSLGSTYPFVITYSIQNDIVSPGDRHLPVAGHRPVPSACTVTLSSVESAFFLVMFSTLLDCWLLGQGHVGFVSVLLAVSSPAQAGGQQLPGQTPGIWYGLEV